MFYVVEMMKDILKVRWKNDEVESQLSDDIMLLEERAAYAMLDEEYVQINHARAKKQKARLKIIYHRWDGGY